MHRMTSRVAAIALVSSLVAACSPASNTYETEPKRANAIDFKSKISNPFLRDQVDVTTVYVGDTDGCLRIQANAQNNTAGNATFMYQFTWFDDQGLKLSTNDDHWTRRELNAGAKTEINTVCPTKLGKDWRLEIRPWDK